MKTTLVQVASLSPVSDLKLNLHLSVAYRWYYMQEVADINVFFRGAMANCQ